MSKAETLLNRIKDRQHPSNPHEMGDDFADDAEQDNSAGQFVPFLLVAFMQLVGYGCYLPLDPVRAQ